MAASSAMITVPVDVVSSTGAKVNVTGHVAPGATEPQVWAAVIVALEEVKALKSSAAFPQLVMFRVCCEEVSAGTCPKETLQAAGQTEGAEVLFSLEMKLWTEPTSGLVGDGGWVSKLPVVVGKSEA